MQNAGVYEREHADPPASRARLAARVGTRGSAPRRSVGSAAACAVVTTPFGLASRSALTLRRFRHCYSNL